MNYFATVHGKGFNFRDLRTPMAKASLLCPDLLAGFTADSEVEGPWMCRYDNFSKTH